MNKQPNSAFKFDQLYLKPKLLNWQGSDQLLQKKNETDHFKDLAVGLSSMNMHPVLQSSMYTD